MLRGAGDTLDQLVEDRAVREQARAGDADLARIEEDRAGRACSGRVDIDVERR